MSSKIAIRNIDISPFGALFLAISWGEMPELKQNMELCETELCQ